MPNDKKTKDSNKLANFSTIRKIAGALQANIDDLYRSTYFSDPEDKQQLQGIKNDIDASIKDIMDVNADVVGEPNISKLYERMYMGIQRDPSTVTEFERIFGDNEFVNNLANSYMDNRWVKAVDMEIDEILRYMPKLHEAILTIRDNVLSADSFSKDFLNVEADSPMQIDAEQFSHNIDDLKKKYSLLKLVTDIYDDTSKYGEVFIYCVPYQKAIQRLMDRKYTMRNVVVKTNYHENTISICENGIEEKINITKDALSGENDLGIKIEIENGIISSIVNDEQSARNIYIGARGDCRCFINWICICKYF